MTSSPAPSRRRRNLDEVAAFVMDDPGFDPFRTRPARLGLVVAMALAVAAVPVVHLRFGSFAGLLSLVPPGVLFWALRRSVRIVADLPDEHLDERQRALRDASYVDAYRILAALVLVLGSAGLVLFIVRGEDPDTWTLQLTWDGAFGLFWALLMVALALPSAAIALREVDHPGDR